MSNYYSTIKRDGASAFKGISKEPRLQTRSLAEFGREVGVSTATLAGLRGAHPDFPPVKLQSGKVAYYVYSDLKSWWAKHGVSR